MISMEEVCPWVSWVDYQSGGNRFVFIMSIVSMLMNYFISANGLDILCAIKYERFLCKHKD